MKNAHGREVTCQEAGPLSVEEYVPCGEAATHLVDNGDRQPYWMCTPHADHNVRNRGAAYYVRVHLSVDGRAQ